MPDILSYVLKNFFAVYKIKPMNIDIGYGTDEVGKIWIKRNDNHYFEYHEVLNLRNIIWKEWKKVKIPFLFDNKNTGDIISMNKGNIIINYDIVASSFYLLTNWQEYISQSKDDYGRFSYSDSLQYQLQISEIPVVNYYFDILRDAIETGYNINLIQDLWEKKSFSVCLTHDIDLCESAWIQGSYREFIKGRIFSPIKLITKKIITNDDWFNFDKIIEIERYYKVNSTFMFLANSESKNGIPNADYNISHPKYRKTLVLILKNKSEVAIHGSIGTHKNTDLLKSEIERTSANIKGNRFHFLLYDVYSTPEVLTQSGLKYDSTLYFAETCGFRNSYCFPFYLYDIKNNLTTDIIEIPLTVMDVTFEKKYLNISQEEALQKMINLANEIEKFGGCFTLLWHNTSFSDYKYKGWKEIYCKFLEFAIEKGALITNGENIYELFTTGNSFND